MNQPEVFLPIWIISKIRNWMKNASAKGIYSLTPFLESLSVQIGNKIFW
jgi:hypothetical protein